MKLKVVLRKVSDYVRYDLKEIAFPSSLPDPPHIKKRRKLTWKERYLVSVPFSFLGYFLLFDMVKYYVEVIELMWYLLNI